MAEEWKKVDLTKPPFFFSGELYYLEDYLTEEYAAVYNKEIRSELEGKNLEYLWAEEDEPDFPGDEPAYLENFKFEGWERVFGITAEHCSHFRKVHMVSASSPFTRIHGVNWAIIFECTTPIWIREKGES